MRYEKWIETYEPIKNHLTPNTAVDGYVFLPDGRDLEFVREHPVDRIWTFIVSDESRTPIWLIADGFHWVNAMGYLVTRKPYDTSRFHDVRY